MGYQSDMNRWVARTVGDSDLLAELDQIKSDPDAIADRFYRDLIFGTGGLRGVIGTGSTWKSWMS